MKNSHRQSSRSVTWPPSVGPMVPERVTIRPTVTLATSRRSGGKIVMAVAKTGGIIAPANRPCSARKPIIIGTDDDRPTAAEVTVKPTTAMT